MATNFDFIKEIQIHTNKNNAIGAFLIAFLTVPGLNTQNKQAMQFIAYEKNEGAVAMSQTGMGGY